VIVCESCVKAPAAVKLIEQKPERKTLFLCQRCYDRRKNKYAEGWTTWNLEKESSGK
jgi:protein-arginine kinase activator protein McsA